MAQKTKNTKTRRAALAASVKKGATREDAAAAAGIHVATFYRWIEQGEADLEHDRASVNRELCEAVKKAEGQARVAAVGCISDAIADGNWTAAMTFLERRDPAHWGRRLHVRDETPRSPAPIRQPSVESYEAAFQASFGDQLPEIDPANMMPSIGFDDDEAASKNGSRNGSR